MANLPPPGMNPRDKRPGDRRTLGSTTGRPGGAVWYVLGLVMLMALAAQFYLQPAGKPISYSDFKQAVRNGQVTEVHVAEQTIRGTTIKASAELKTPFVISLQGGYLNQNYYDPAEQDIEDFNVKLVYRLFIP